MSLPIPSIREGSFGIPTPLIAGRNNLLSSWYPMHSWTQGLNRLMLRDLTAEEKVLFLQEVRVLLWGPFYWCSIGGQFADERRPRLINARVVHMYCERLAGLVCCIARVCGTV